MKTIVKSMFIVIVMFFMINNSIYINAQKEKTSTIYFHKAKILDSIFFHQLDSILNIKQIEYHKFYRIRYDNMLDGMKLILSGFETDALIDTDLYLVKFNKRRYWLDKKLNNSLILKDKQFSHTYDLSRGLVMGDFVSTYLILEYKNKKLTVEADSRVDKYLVE